MAETLGSLCDKLTIIKLKQWHSQDEERLESLKNQQILIQKEINEFINNSLQGNIPIERLTFNSNKVFKKEGNIISEVTGNIGEAFSQLAQANCELWHEQEKVYDFENVPLDEKNIVVKKLAHLNLLRNKCIDQIDCQFKNHISNLNTL